MGAGLGQVVLIVANGRPERLPFAVLTVTAGVLALIREVPRVTGTTWVVPNRWAGAQRYDAAEIDRVEVPESVWSTERTTLVLGSGTRLVLTGVDRLRAMEFADRLGVAVAKVP
jgi:hypothetical protein